MLVDVILQNSAVIGIIIGCLIFVALAILLGLFFHKKKKVGEENTQRVVLFLTWEKKGEERSCRIPGKANQLVSLLQTKEQE